MEKTHLKKNGSEKTTTCNMQSYQPLNIWLVWTLEEFNTQIITREISHKIYLNGKGNLDLKSFTWLKMLNFILY